MIDDLREVFKDSDFIKTIFPDYNGEYENIIIKEKYEMYPEIQYPMCTIEEINNSNATRYKDDSGEFASDLGYQFDISCEQSENITAQQNVRRVATIINTYLQGDRYHCLDRIGGLAIKPSISDNNVKTGYLRYNCVVRHDNNTIYRRY